VTVNWLQALIGALLGFIGGFILGGFAVPAYKRWAEKRELAKLYRRLTGEYANYVVNPDWTQESTEGTIKLVWDLAGAVLKATGFHSNGQPEWTSDIVMTLIPKDAGTGYYHFVDSILSGTHLVIYSRDTKSLQVLGHTSNEKEFAHYWRLKQ
jgi:hypothetical protein